MLMIVTAVTATLLIIMESIISWKNEVAIRVLKLMISMRLRGANSITPFTQLRAKSIRIPS
jgi:hypothetical protein